MVHSVFNLPEIVSAVLRQVDHPKTLSRCARVNSFWHREAVALLWYGEDRSSQFLAADPGLWDSPNVDHLLSLAKDPDRFRYYTSFIRHLDVLYGDTNNADTASLWNEHLWDSARFVSVTVDIGSFNMAEERMRNLLKPSLRSLMLFGKSSIPSTFRSSGIEIADQLY